MKLYYAPGACSLASHIISNEAGLGLELEKVNLKEHKTESGRDFYEVTPKGYVPVLEISEDRQLSEGLAILIYLADLKPEFKLTPEFGSFERYQHQEWLNFVSTELHKNMGALFAPNVTEEVKEAVFEKLEKRFLVVEARLAETDAFLVDENFSAADAYLFVCTRWAVSFGLDFSNKPLLEKFMQTVAERPAVKKSMEEEGLK